MVSLIPSLPAKEKFGRFRTPLEAAVIIRS